MISLSIHSEIRKEFKTALYGLNETLSNAYMTALNSVAEDIVQELNQLDVLFANYSIEDFPIRYWDFLNKLKKETAQIKHLVLAQNSEKPYFGEELQESIARIENGLSAVSAVGLSKSALWF